MNDLTKYHQIRDLMRSGDGLGYRNVGLLSDLIAWRTKGDGPISLSHWGGIVRMGEFEGKEFRRFSIEALHSGFVPLIFSDLIKDYPGEVYWYPLKEAFRKDHPSIGYDAMGMIGKPYDWAGLIKQVGMRVNADARKFWCSEAWQLLYGFQGEGLTPTGMHRLGIFENPVRIL